MANGQLERTPGGVALDGDTDRELLERFAVRRDEGAFGGLVRRYGPLVYGVCRRVLRDAHEAEDAFQATFLVLARRAGSIARPELLGNWLYGVAYRISLKARASAARRQTLEPTPVGTPPEDPAMAAAWREIRLVLDDELHQLPEKFRAPLVLCYLEGKTQEEAAALLGCPSGSMSWRLERGRELLRQRLHRRGLALSLGALAPMLAYGAAQAAPALVETTLRLAALFTRSELGGPVAALARQILGEAKHRKLLAAVLAVAAVFFILGGALAFHPLAGAPPRVFFGDPSPSSVGKDGDGCSPCGKCSTDTPPAPESSEPPHK